MVVNGVMIMSWDSVARPVFRPCTRLQYRLVALTLYVLPTLVPPSFCLCTRKLGKLISMIRRGNDLGGDLSMERIASENAVEFGTSNVMHQPIKT
jgi:hypothetical protein